MVGNFMNVKEAAAYLEYTNRHVAWLCGQGELVGAKKDGLMWFIPEETVKIYKLSHPRRHKETVKPDGALSAQTVYGENECSCTVA